MTRRPPRSTRTATLFPYPTLSELAGRAPHLGRPHPDRARAAGVRRQPDRVAVTGRAADPADPRGPGRAGVHPGGPARGIFAAVGHLTLLRPGHGAAARPLRLPPPRLRAPGRTPGAGDPRDIGSA